tara:strand:+ start:70 stop:1014 length:945 start_codon:yes stop_codon:yes gene_type:complete
MIEKIKKVPLRSVWKHEAHDFTTWLENNIDVLTDELDIDFSNVEREVSAGRFSVDLVAETPTSERVIIENQLEASNHDHLGKVITYLTVLDAKIAVWIVSKPRPEHVQAITWLNESSDASFYLFKIEAIQIGNSNPAPLLTLIVGPSIESKEIGKTKKALTDNKILIKEFWTVLLDYSNKTTNLFNNISPTTNSYINKNTGTSGFMYVYSVRQYSSQIELYIDKGLFYSSHDVTPEDNTELFEQLYINKKEIESKFKNKLIWDKLENRRACRVSFVIEGGYKSNNDEWESITKKLVDHMISFSEIVYPYVKKIK